MTKTLVDDVYQKIQCDIISNKLLPGQRLHITQLASHYKVGPGPIREALFRLLSTELVISISQKGFRVASISRENLRDIYTTRAHVESIALSLSIKCGKDEWEANLIGAYHRLAKFEAEYKIIDQTDYIEWERRHRAFNLGLIGACGLEHLLRIQTQLYNLTERYRKQWVIMGTQQADELPYAKEQKKIMEASLNRDTEKATKLLYKHFENAIKIIQEYLAINHLCN